MNYYIFCELVGAPPARIRERFIWARDLSPSRIGLYWEPDDKTRVEGSFQREIYPTRTSAEVVAKRIGGTVEGF